MTERQLLAIFVSDVVGYSRLIAQDEAWTVATLRQRHKSMAELVERHGGTVLKLVGDGMVAGFTSAVRAVECAVAIQQDDAARNAAASDGKAMLQRIGINLGEVVHADGEIYGDGINVAARLEAIAPPGGIAISAKVHDEVAGRLGQPFTDKGEQELKNIPRPVRVFEVRWDGRADLAAPEPSSKPESAPEPGGGRGFRWPLAVAAVLGVALLLGGVGWWSQRPAPVDTAQIVQTPQIAPAPAARPKPWGPDDRRLSTIVLPLSGPAADKEATDHADAMTAALQNEFSKIYGLRLIPIGAAEVYRGRTPDPREVAASQRINFVVQGSVRQAGGRFQVTLTAYDRDGQIVLTRRTDMAGPDPAEDRDRIARWFVQGVSPAMRRAETKWGLAEHPEDPDARDLFFRATTEDFTRENWKERLSLLDAGIKKGPEFPQLWQARVNLLWYVSIFGWGQTESLTPDLQSKFVVNSSTWVELKRAHAEWRRLVRPTDGNYYAEMLLLDVRIARYESRLEYALEGIEAVLRLNPTRVFALREKGTVLRELGRFDEAVSTYATAVERAESEINVDWSTIWTASFGYVLAGRYDEGARLARRALSLMPPTAPAAERFQTLRTLVAALGHSGSTTEATRVMDEAAKTDPGRFAKERLSGWRRRIKDEANRPESYILGLERYIDGLRKAGWPE